MAPPTEIVDCQETRRVCPKQTVCATAGSRCNRAHSSASITAGARRVTTVLARVDPVAELLASLLELGEARVAGAQVVLGRDQIGLRDPDRRLRAALALRVCGDARLDREPVMARDRDDLRITDRNPRG